MERETIIHSPSLLRGIFFPQMFSARHPTSAPPKRAKKKKKKEDKCGGKKKLKEGMITKDMKPQSSHRSNERTGQQNVKKGSWGEGGGVKKEGTPRL